MKSLTQSGLAAHLSRQAAHVNELAAPDFVAALRANTSVVFTGVVSLSEFGNLAWSLRAAVFSIGRSPSFANAGSFSITCPSSGVAIIGVGGATSVTTTGSGIPFTQHGCGLYYILPLRTPGTFVPTNFRIVGNSADFTPPAHWVRLAYRDSDTNLVYTACGLTLANTYSVEHTPEITVPDSPVTLDDLAPDVLAVLGGGLDPTKYQGQWVPATNSPTIPAAAPANDGFWYQCSAAGTATGTAADGIYQYADSIKSNGVQWLKLSAPPTNIPPNSITETELSPTLRSYLTTIESNDYAFLLTDRLNRIGLAVDLNGNVIGKFVLVLGSVTESKLADHAVSYRTLSADLQSALPTSATCFDYVYALTDQVDRLSFAVRLDGYLTGHFAPFPGTLNGVALTPGSVTEVHLSASLTSGLAIRTSGEREFVYSITDQNDRVAFGIRADGSLYGKLALAAESIDGSSFIQNTVDETRFTAEVRRNLLSVPDEKVPSSHDLLWRGVPIACPNYTEAGDGAMFSRFPPLRTPVLFGVNSTGVSLDFMRAPRFVFRGLKYISTWAASGTPPASSATYGDWWLVSSAGSFNGDTYAVNDRIICMGTKRVSSTFTVQWAKGKPGEFFFRGEFSPTAFSAGTPVDGDAYVASSAGSFGGKTYAIGDHMLRVSGAWLKSAAVDYITVPNGDTWSFSVENAFDLQVRRTDKSAGTVSVIGTAYHTPLQKRSVPSIIFRGDSMVATAKLDIILRDLLHPRTVTSFSYPAANSQEILATVRQQIRTGGDLYRGWFNLWFMGTNDTTNFTDKAKRGALEAYALSGANDGRSCFLMYAGQQIYTWNGSRFVGFYHEPGQAGRTPIAELEQWYKDVFPGHCLMVRDIMLAGATSKPHIHFPGMTERQVADTYGVLPASAYVNLEYYGLSAETITFRGYRSAAGLPTGGADGDYWLRNANGALANHIVRQGGVWTEYAQDPTHFTEVGNTVLANAIVDYLETNHF